MVTVKILDTDSMPGCSTRPRGSLATMLIYFLTNLCLSSLFYPQAILLAILIL